MRAVDTNVLVYAHRREAPEHEVARKLLEGLAADPTPWAIPWPCVYEFFSVVTNPLIWKAAASTPQQAVEQLEAWFESPSLSLLSETEDFPRVLLALLRGPRVRGPVAHDARIAALCLAHGVEALLSRDRDFAFFPALTLENPFA